MRITSQYQDTFRELTDLVHNKNKYLILNELMSEDAGLTLDELQERTNLEFTTIRNTLGNLIKPLRNLNLPNFDETEIDLVEKESQFDESLGVIDNEVRYILTNDAQIIISGIINTLMNVRTTGIAELEPKLLDQFYEEVYDQITGRTNANFASVLRRITAVDENINTFQKQFIRKLRSRSERLAQSPDLKSSIEDLIKHEQDQLEEYKTKVNVTLSGVINLLSPKSLELNFNARYEHVSQANVFADVFHAELNSGENEIEAIIKKLGNGETLGTINASIIKISDATIRALSSINALAKNQATPTRINDFIDTMEQIFDMHPDLATDEMWPYVSAKLAAVIGDVAEPHMYMNRGNEILVSNDKSSDISPDQVRNDAEVLYVQDKSRIKQVTEETVIVEDEKVGPSVTDVARQNAKDFEKLDFDKHPGKITQVLSSKILEYVRLHSSGESGSIALLDAADVAYVRTDINKNGAEPFDMSLGLVVTSTTTPGHNTTFEYTIDDVTYSQTFENRTIVIEKRA